MKLSEQLDQLIAAVEKAASLHLFYQPKDPTRDYHHRQASLRFEEFGEWLKDLRDDRGYLLTQAEEAEQEAEAEEKAV